jgi:DNA-directed RNA polymerase specialized sigma24 family protein
MRMLSRMAAVAATFPRVDKPRKGGKVVDFPANTSWSTIHRAGFGGDPVAQDKFFRAYSRPVAILFRALGCKPDEVDDLVQEFFLVRLSSPELGSLDPRLGTFRSWLRPTARHFYYNHVNHGRAQKRDWRVQVTVDSVLEANRHPEVLVDTATADLAFDCGWVATIVDHAFRRLRAEYETAPNAELILHLFDDDVDLPADAAIATRRGTTALNVRVQRCRLKKAVEERFAALLRDELGAKILARFGVLLREEIAKTVTHRAAVERELAELIDVLG